MTSLKELIDNFVYQQQTRDRDVQEIVFEYIENELITDSKFLAEVLSEIKKLTGIPLNINDFRSAFPDGKMKDGIS